MKMAENDVHTPYTKDREKNTGNIWPTEHAEDTEDMQTPTRERFMIRFFRAFDVFRGPNPD